MPEELGSTLKNLVSLRKNKFGDLEIISGKWKFLDKRNLNVYLSIAWSGWGKVSAARAATRLLSIKYENLPVEMILFTGVAGGVYEKLKQWDIVIADSLVQHDMDARPIFKKFEIPALKEIKIKPNENFTNWVFKNLEDSMLNDNMNPFGKIYKGLIATGDQFVSDKNVVRFLSEEINGLYAVEMEGAAVAQVAIQEKIPFQIIRIISDGANESSHEDFSKFLIKYVKYSANILTYLIENIETIPNNISLNNLSL